MRCAWASNRLMSQRKLTWMVKEMIAALDKRGGSDHAMFLAALQDADSHIRVVSSSATDAASLACTKRL